MAERPNAPTWRFPAALLAIIGNTTISVITMQNGLFVVSVVTGLAALVIAFIESSRLQSTSHEPA